MYTYNCSLKRVVDGDTVDVVIDLGFDIKYKARVRLSGINAPESRTRDLAEKALGLAAKARLKELLKAKGGMVIKTSLDRKGKFGRLLGILYKEGLESSVNATMVLEGHAVVYNGGKR